MPRLNLLILGTLLFISSSKSFAQMDEFPIRIFGYFQNSLTHQTEFNSSFNREPENNSFSVQQLNLFFQKDLAENWRAFVNFEFLNNFSSSRQWGAHNLEEAWVRFRSNEKFNLKLGLMIPQFNHFNEIKNRTPLLPYIIRPIAYETSFSEFIATEEYFPARAFAQAYGFLPFGEAKFDYALFFGNSPNINTDSEQGQTGVDSTDTFLIGGRFGVRLGELKVGLSATRENVSGSPTVPAAGEQEPAFSFKRVPRVRLGGDFSYHVGKFSFESELVIVRYDDEMPNVSIDKEFYYGTLGYRITDQLFIYGSYWFVQEDFSNFDAGIFSSGSSEIEVPNVGMAYNLNDRITFKGQFALVDINLEIPALQLEEKAEFNHYSIAASIFF